ncbi:MAG: hypothetical protein ACK57N_03625 [Planctomycetia bacterium]|jgi:hypothetical protein
MTPLWSAAALFASTTAFLVAQAPVAQDGVPPPPPPVAATPAVPAWLDVDGAALEPGKLPSSTREEARKAFELLRAAPRAKLAEPYPLTGFDLRVDLRYRGAEGARNDLPDARWQWLAPDCLRLSTGRKRELLRGPKGDWLVDASRTPPEFVELGVAREHREDRRALDEGLALARTVASLFDLRALRLRRVEAAAPPACPNEALAARAGELAWLLVETPDLTLPPSAEQRPSGMVRALLGYDRVLGLVEQAQLAELRPAATGEAPGASPPALHVALRDHRLVDGILVPHHFAVHGAGGGGRLRAEAGMDGYLRGASLKPAFAREQFAPGASSASAPEKAAPGGG